MERASSNYIYRWKSTQNTNVQDGNYFSQEI